MKKLILMLFLVVGGVLSAAADDNYYSLPGTWSDWNTETYKFDANNTVTIRLKAKTTYDFQFYNKQYNSWSGIKAWADMATNSTMKFDGNQNVGITTTYAGDYKFSFTWDSGCPVISVTYPTEQYYIVHFKNENVGSGVWTKVCCHTYNSKEDGDTWPGPELSSGNSGYYDAYVSSLYDVVMFNNGGHGENNQTAGINVDFNTAAEFWVKCDGSKDGDSYYNATITTTAPSGWIGHTRTVTPGKFGTICLPFNATVEGAKVYQIKSKTVDGESNVTGINLETVNTLEAGKAYIYKATAYTLTATYSGSYTAATEANGMLGNLSSGSITAPVGSFVVSGNQIHEVAAGTGVNVGQYKAYITTLTDVPVAVGGARADLFLGFDDEITGIETVKEGTADNAVFNLQGQRVMNAQKGLYIVNGKKMLMK